MTVYIDTARNRFGRMVMCHMIADTPRELHAMAARIGMKREWFQGDHYDVSLTRKEFARRAGAIEITTREMVSPGNEATGKINIERARRLIVRAFMGFGSNAHSSSPTARKTGFRSHSRVKSAPREPTEGGYRSTGFRANSSRSGTTPAHDWAHYPQALLAVIERLTGVTIEHRDATEVMAQHDSPETLHYVDPPYLPETRSPANKYDLKHRMYRHELTRDNHAALLEFLRDLSGMVVVSGYASPLYDDALPDWCRIEIDTFADGARPRTEILWLNPACCAALDRARDDHQTPLFAGAPA